MKNSSVAILIVDFQKCFMPGGTLPVAVPEPDKFTKRTKIAMARVKRAGGVVVATQDYHDLDDPSFAINGGPWPTHGVRGTEDADFATEAVPLYADVIIRKTAYSACEGTGLIPMLRQRGVQFIFAIGLTLDYCYGLSVIDLQEAGFQVIVADDATCAVNAADGEAMWRRLEAAKVNRYPTLERALDELL